ncbi:MAG TPA: hypothetical protein VM491_06590, partial [Burkholderiaceae bacterium]|nr:hypothetical protein [Burkholderiaceae bacterium]
MSIVVEIRGGTGAAQQIDLTGRVKIEARPGENYRLLSADKQRFHDDVVIRRIGDDLVIDGLPNGRALELGRFFTACTPAQPCALSTENLGGSRGERITPATEALAT